MKTNSIDDDGRNALEREGERGKRANTHIKSM